MNNTKEKTAVGAGTPATETKNITTDSVSETVHNMKITLISLILENFKGIQKFEFVPNGKNTSVFGTNASGKTTLADAYYWLLFGKDSSGTANFDVKTTGTTGLDYSVEGIIEVDGERHTLKRTLNEKWERRRGDTEKKLKGNTTTYFIDDVPVKEKDFRAFIENNLVSEKTYQMLTDPDYFAGKLDWKGRRQLLMEWFADVSDTDIISAHGNLHSLTEILNGRSIEDTRKAIQTNRKKINELLQTIPSRIDEQQRNIIQIQSLVHGDEQQRLDELLKKKSQLEEDMKSISSDERLAKAKAEMEKIKLEILQAKSAYLSKSSADDSTRQSLADLNKTKTSIESEIYRLIQEIDFCNRRLVTITQQGKAYNDDFQRISAEQYQGNNICPCCGQLLPEEKIQSAISEFNLQKSRKLEEIKAACQKLKAERADLKKKIEVNTGNLELSQERLKTLNSDIEQLEKSMSEVIPFEQTEEYEVLSAKLTDVQEQAETLLMEEDFTEKIIGIKVKIADIEKEIARLHEVIAKKNSISMYESRIEELKQDEKNYGLLLAKSDNELMLIEEFIRTKCAEIEGRINSHFDLVKWKLFDLQVNGGISDCCEATVGGVDYSTNLNSAAKINAGLDIINAISNVTDTYVPIWIDNAESVVELINTNSQTIRLVVSEEYQKLTVKE